MHPGIGAVHYGRSPDSQGHQHPCVCCTTTSPTPASAPRLPSRLPSGRITTAPAGGVCRPAAMRCRTRRSDRFESRHLPQHLWRIPRPCRPTDCTTGAPALYRGWAWTSAPRLRIFGCSPRQSRLFCDCFADFGFCSPCRTTTSISRRSKSTKSLCSCSRISPMLVPVYLVRIGRRTFNGRGGRYKLRRGKKCG